MTLCARQSWSVPKRASKWHATRAPSKRGWWWWWRGNVTLVADLHVAGTWQCTDAWMQPPPIAAQQHSRSLGAGVRAGAGAGAPEEGDDGSERVTRMTMTRQARRRNSASREGRGKGTLWPPLSVGSRSCLSIVSGGLARWWLCFARLLPTPNHRHTSDGTGAGCMPA